MKPILILLTGLALAVAATPVLAAEAPSSAQWLRYPAISPDGGAIAFSHKGDIWTVPAAGGDARPLTVGEAYEFAPVWSRDGSRIAFASDRFGGFDVFIMPAAGGPAERLTFHSAGEVPSGFAADDAAVLFSAVRQDPASNAQYPTGLMSELYSVPAAGGRVTRVLPVAAQDAVADADGRLLYHDVKGYESPWRKHHVSAVTRDVWLHDPGDGSYRQVSTFAGEDRNPVFGDGGAYYWLSERDGTFNVWRGSLAGAGQDEQITTFERHPVRFLTRSDGGVLCFGWDGGIYTLQPGGQPQAVAVRIAVDGREDLPQVAPVRDKFTEMALAPGGKEFAYVFRGEIFVSAVEGGVTKRVTDTPWQERSVSWSPDGRSLAYAVEVDGSWDVHVTSIVRDEEPYFHVSTVLETKPAVSTPAEEFQPAFSPDGEEIAYLEDRVTVKVVELKSGRTRTVLPGRWNYSYADGDQYFAWSPDGQWLAVEFGYPDRVFYREVGLVAADGKGEVRNLTLNGYEDLRPRWALDGKAIVWGSDREGAKREGGGSVTGDVYAMFLTREAWDRFHLTKEELALVKEQEEKAKKEDEKKDEKKKDDDEDEDEKPAEPVAIDFDGLADRFARLTTHTSPVEDWLLSQDGETLYYVTSFEKGDDLWSVEMRTGETKLFVKVGANISDLQMSKDGKVIAFLADGKPRQVEIDKGEAKPLATKGEMVLRTDAERAYIFDHVWRQLERKFYLDGLHGVDWDFYRASYERFLPDINNNHDFAEMLSEMLGELNASHTGCYYRPDREGADQTASLGLFYDDAYDGPGLRVDEVITGGPLDKAAVKLRAGHVIEKIDGRPVDGAFDWVELLNRKAGEITLLSVRDPDGGDRWDETVKPISGGEEYQLLYERWVRQRRAEVEKLSDGRLGYVHVRSMNDASMRTVFAEALGRHLEAEGLIVDTRFNGGGNIHEELSDFLSGKPYFDIIPRGQYVGSEPYDKWKKPSIVIMGESNYSDAHLFPVAYKLKGVGKTLGMPVPGTGTFVWWERQIDPSLRFGIPMGGWRAPDGAFCENTQLEPDIRVRNEPGVMSAGRDQQLEAAVQELLGR